MSRVTCFASLFLFNSPLEVGRQAFVHSSAFCKLVHRQESLDSLVKYAVKVPKRRARKTLPASNRPLLEHRFNFIFPRSSLLIRMVVGEREAAHA